MTIRVKATAQLPENLGEYGGIILPDIDLLFQELGAVVAFQRGWLVISDLLPASVDEGIENLIQAGFLTTGEGGLLVPTDKLAERYEDDEEDVK